MIPIQSALIRSTTAPCQSQTADKSMKRNTCQELKRLCAEKFDRRCMASGGTFGLALGWGSRVLKVTRDFALCVRDRTIFSWSIAHVSVDNINLERLEIKDYFKMITGNSKDGCNDAGSLNPKHIIVALLMMTSLLARRFI